MEAIFVGLLERLQPTTEYLRFFRAVVLDAWKERQGGVRELREGLQRRAAAIQSRLELLDEKFIYGEAIDRQTYQQQRDKLREELALAEIDLQDARIEEVDIDGVLSFSEHVVGDAARLWIESNPDQKQRLQSVFFPQGLPFDGESFRTTPMCLAFKQFEETTSGENGVASPTGFEPVF